MRSTLRILLFVSLVALFAGCSDSKKPTSPAAATPLATTVEGIRVRHGLPALGLAVIDRDSIRVTITGVRRRGAPNRAQTGDLFHLGSLAKAMTATMIGRLVEAGTLSWNLTLVQAFPEFSGSIVAEYRNVTLAQLLQHRGGVPAFETLEDFAVLPSFPGNDVQQRHAFVSWLVTRPPAVTPGTYLYSNAGYAVAAAMAEAAAGSSWEQLLTNELLDPLGVSATFGWPTDHDANQPWGHVAQGDSLVPFDPAQGHVPTVVAPAGDLSQSLEAYGRFARLHLRALLGTPQLLSASTFRTLHTPTVGDYAMGWQLLTLQGRLVYAHDGSAGTFTTLVLLDPARGGAYVIVTNAVSDQVEAAFTEVLTAVAPRFAALPAGSLVRAGFGRPALATRAAE